MKYLKKYNLFEKSNLDFTGWIELTYLDREDTVMVDVYSNGEIFDIYTTKKNYFDFVKWIPGDNPLYVHCVREDYPDFVEYLLSGDDVSRNVHLAMDEEDDDMDEDLYKELELRMENRYEAEAEQMQNVKKYNL